MAFGVWVVRISWQGVAGDSVNGGALIQNSHWWLGKSCLIWVYQTSTVLGLVEFIVKMAPLSNDRKIGKVCTATVGEVWKAFSTFFSSIPENQRTLVAVLFDPGLVFIIGTHVLCILLPNQPSTMDPVTSQTVAQLLSCATSSPAAFKEAASKLDQSKCDLLEQSIRRAIGSNASAASATAKPQISLHSF